MKTLTLTDKNKIKYHINAYLPGENYQDDFSSVAFSGDYNDLKNLPNIPEGSAVDTQLNAASSNAIANSTVVSALNKKSDISHTHSEYITSDTIATVASTGDYNDLKNKPNIPDNITVDTELDKNSNNSIANSTVTIALNTKSDTSHNHDNTYVKLEDVQTALSQSSTLPISTSIVTQELNNLSNKLTTHEHNYAGAANPGGAASTATISDSVADYKDTSSIYISYATTSTNSEYLLNIQKDVDKNYSTACAIAIDDVNYVGSAQKLADKSTATTYSVGSATQGTYFNNGIPVAMSYSVQKSVPSDAVFTDTTYSSGTGIDINGTTISANGQITSNKITFANGTEIWIE